MSGGKAPAVGVQLPDIPAVARRAEEPAGHERLARTAGGHIPQTPGDLRRFRRALELQRGDDRWRTEKRVAAPQSRGEAERRRAGLGGGRGGGAVISATGERID